MKTVYLSGPIAHCSFGECTGWREDVEQSLKFWGIKALSPMRGKDFLKDVKSFTQDCSQYSHNPLSSPKGIMCRDRYDSMTCDVLLINLLGATKVSIGSMMEVAWADAKRTPIVLVMEADGSNVHEHSMLNEAAGYRVATLHEAVDIVRLILGAENPLDTYPIKVDASISRSGGIKATDISFHYPRTLTPVQTDPYKYQTICAHDGSVDLGKIGRNS